MSDESKGRELVNTNPENGAKGAEEAEKQGGLLSKIKDWFKHSQESIDAKMAKKAGVENVEEFVKGGGKEKWVAENADEAKKLQGKVGKLNKTKAGIVAGAAVLIGSALAGSGNKGPGERATQIRQQQEAAELAAAQGQGMGA